MHVREKPVLCCHLICHRSSASLQTTLDSENASDVGPFLISVSSKPPRSAATKLSLAPNGQPSLPFSACLSHNYLNLAMDCPIIVITPPAALLNRLSYYVDHSGHSLLGAGPISDTRHHRSRAYDLIKSPQSRCKPGR